MLTSYYPSFDDVYLTDISTENKTLRYLRCDKQDVTTEIKEMCYKEIKMGKKNKNKERK